MTLTAISRLGSLLTLLFVGKRTASMNSDLIQRFMSGCATILGLAVIAALFTGLLLVAGLYVTYIALLGNGFTVASALLITCLMVAAIIMIVVIMIQRQIQSLKQLPSAFVQPELPIASGVTGVASAFVDGLMGVDKKPQAARRQ